MHREGMISIWFFIGLLLLVYGILILGDRNFGLVVAAERGAAPTCTPPSGGACSSLCSASFYSHRFSPKKRTIGPNDFRSDRRQSRFLPGHLAQSGRVGNARRVGESRLRGGGARSRGFQIRRGGNPRRSGALRRPVQEASRRRSTASSSRCPISATSAPSPIRCAWPASTCRCWCRPRPILPAR